MFFGDTWERGGLEGQLRSHGWLVGPVTATSTRSSGVAASRSRPPYLGLGKSLELRLVGLENEN
jgi:hypothetical protein